MSESQTRPTDGHSEGVVEARLGRRARDVLEATVVLEAWKGEPARSAMSSARELVDEAAPPALVPKAQFEDPDDRDQRGVVAEGVTLVLSILSVAAWAAPLGAQLGKRTFAIAITVALPLAVAVQWGLRSRYLSRRRGLSLLVPDAAVLFLFTFLPVELGLFLQPGWGRLAALLMPIWVGGTVLTRRGWGPVYATALVAGTFELDRHAPGYWVLGALASACLAACLLAVVTRRSRTDDRAGSTVRALLAGLLGGSVGVLLVADPSLGWGEHGVYPAVALVPSVIGSFWGGYYLWNFYRAIPRKLRGVPLNSASRAALSDPAMSIFAGAVLRLVGATVVLSAVVILVSRWTHTRDDLTVFVAFGAAALVSLLLGLLESLALHRPALCAAAAAVLAELAWRRIGWVALPGMGLVVGATVGALLTLPPLIARLARSGRVLATTLWIQ